MERFKFLEKKLRIKDLTKTDRLDDDGDDETNTKNMGQAISNFKEFLSNT